MSAVKKEGMDTLVEAIMLQVITLRVLCSACCSCKSWSVNIKSAADSSQQAVVRQQNRLSCSEPLICCVPVRIAGVEGPDRMLCGRLSCGRMVVCKLE